MSARVHKRLSPAKRRRGNLLSQKDEHLCALEWQQTISNVQIEALEKTRRELEDSANSFAALYEHGPVGYLTLDHTGCIRDANATACRLLGFNRDKLRHLPFTFMIHRDDVGRFLGHLGQCQKSKQRLVTELRLQTNKKTIIPIQMVSAPFEKRGRKMFLTALVDLTHRQQNEEALASAKEFAESIVETIREPLAVLDADLKIVSINTAFARFFQRSEILIKGTFFEGLLNLWWSGNNLRSELEKVLIKNQPLENFEITVEPRKLGKRVLLLNARNLYERSGSPAHILIALEDITARKQAEEQLHTINHELEKRVAARTAALEKSVQNMESFCYSIAHDLRAPLRSMRGFSELLGDMCGPQMEADAKDYLERIKKSAERMDQLILGLLNYGRLNTVDLPLANVDLEKVFQEALVHCQHDIEEKKARIEKLSELPLVRGHELTLKVSLTNLLSNAIKFVPPNVRPRIKVGCEHKDTCIRVWIEDNGIGIAPEYHQKIFGVFQRLHDAKSYPGTGIGLALVSRGIERIGGYTGVESAPGKGSRFWLELLKGEGVEAQQLSPH
jgi:PAS domain S-box-containing protein